MNILFISYDIPYPLNAGGKIRAYYLLRELSKSHSVHLLSFYRNDEQLKFLSKLKHITSSITTIKRRKIFSFKNIIKSVSLPFPAALYYDDNLHAQINELIQSKAIDLIHYESFYTSMYISSDFKLPQVIGTENIEWNIYEQYREQQPFIIRQLLKFEINRIRNFEENTWKKASSCLAVSSENASVISKFNKDCEVIGNGIDEEQFVSIKRIKDTNHRFTVLFFGNLRYLQNKDAVNWLINTIWPRVDSYFEGQSKPKLLLVGHGLYTDVNISRLSSIEIRGEVDDVSPIYAESDLVVAPLRIGSGTKFKILEACASQLPVITTQIGAEGLSKLEDGKDFIIAKNEDNLVSEIISLTNDAKRRKVLGKNAKEKVTRWYSWNSIGKTLRSYYENLINHNC